LITEFNGKIVLNSRKLQLFVADCHIGEKVKLTVIRDGNPMTIVAQIVDLEPQEDEAMPVESTKEKGGVTFSNISPMVISKFGLEQNSKGVVVTEISQELNFDLRIGDLIMAINQEYINDVEQFNNVYERIKNGNKKNVVLLVRRREFTMFVAMPIK
jgi:serine protease Do